MRGRMLLTVLAIVILTASGVLAQEARSVDEIIEDATEACQPEINAYCSQVTPGEGRLLACFYAHQDKISGRCEFALYDAAATLEDFAAAVAYLAEACHDDLMKYCAEVEMGEGRVGMCLLEHKEQVSSDCRTAMDEGGLVALEEEG